MEDLEPSYEYSPTGFPVSRPIQYFGLAFRTPNTIRLVNVDQHIASCVQEKVEQLLPVEKSGYVCFRKEVPPTPLIPLSEKKSDGMMCTSLLTAESVRPCGEDTFYYTRTVSLCRW